MTRTRVVGLGIACTLLLAAGARAQERPLDEDAARARAGRFLCEGQDAPRPDLGPEDVAGLDVLPVEDRLHGPAFDVLLRSDGGALRLVVRVDRAEGRVLYFSQPERDATVPRWREDRTPRPAEELADETRARILYDEPALRRRALAFVERLVPGVLEGRRRFEVVHHAALRDGLLADAFVLVEAPVEGVLACFRNLVQLDVNPESGEVVSVRRTDLRLEVRTPPPVDAEAAVAAARAALDVTGAPTQGPTLEVLRREGGRLAAVWVVGFGEPAGVACVVDAQSGHAERVR